MYKVDSEVRVVATPPVKKFAGGLYFSVVRMRLIGNHVESSPSYINSKNDVNYCVRCGKMNHNRDLEHIVNIQFETWIVF
jgi:hypothetical protein